MVIIGKLHEISFYGILSSIVCICLGKTNEMLSSFGKPITCYSEFYYVTLLWLCIAFVPIAIIGAFGTKYRDHGKGLSFKTNNILVIIFAHIAEEVLVLILTPFWLLIDIFTSDFDDWWKIVDYITYVLEIVYFTVGIVLQ